VPLNSASDDDRLGAVLRMQRRQVWEMHGFGDRSRSIFAVVLVVNSLI
jgi:hypothetical protein